MTLALAMIAALSGCSSAPTCASPEDPAATAGGDVLTCSDAGDVLDYIELLAGRAVSRADRSAGLGAVAARFTADPAGTRKWIDEVRDVGRVLAERTGMAAAEARSTLVWHADHGDDLITADDGALWSVQRRALAVWAKDDDEKLAVTESDLEAWIRYASLCREVQGGGVLRISVADRVTVYRVLIDRFNEGDRQTEIAAAAFGPVWPQVDARWKAASYERQQEWIAAAPLPPPMTATSLGYAEAVFGPDLWRHALVLHDVLGPFSIGAEERFTSEAP